MTAQRAKLRYRVLPRLMTERERDVCLSTLAWAVRPFQDQVELFVELAPGLSKEVRIPDYFDPHIAEALAQVQFRFDVEAADAARVLAWRRDTLPPLAAPSITLVDPEHVLHHTFELQKRLLEDLGAMPESSSERLTQLKNNGAQRAFLFGPGPSLAALQTSFEEFDLSSGLRLVCNGVVLNREATDLIQPHVACAIDPLYHGGVSFYSGRFVDELRRIMELHGTLFVTRREFVPWLRERLPEEQIVGMEFCESTPFHCDLSAQPFLSNLNGNVLNAAMLPVGAYLSTELLLLGFDGKDPQRASSSEGNRFFWDHDKRSSIQGWEERITQVNPKVFRRDFEAYHRRHADTVHHVLARLKRSGRRVFRLNEPFIEALAALPRWGDRNGVGIAANADSVESVIHARRRVVICVSFREFDGSLNDSIQRRFLDSLNLQSDRHFLLCVTNFREKNVRAVLEGYDFDWVFRQSDVDTRVSLSSLLEHGIDYLEPGRSILVYTNADHIFPPHFVETLVDHFVPGSSGIFYPQLVYNSLQDFTMGRAMFSPEAGPAPQRRGAFPPREVGLSGWLQLDPNYWVMDVTFADGDLLLSPDYRRRLRRFRFDAFWPGPTQSVIITSGAPPELRKNLFFQVTYAEIVNQYGASVESDASRVYSELRAQEFSTVERLKTVMRQFAADAGWDTTEFDDPVLAKLRHAERFQIVGTSAQRALYQGYLDFWRLRYQALHAGALAQVQPRLEQYKAELRKLFSAARFESPP